MKSFRLTPRAEQDLTDIWDYLAEDNIEAADRVMAAIEKAANRLAANPGIGHLREDLADRRHRFWLVYSYLIAQNPARPHSVVAATGNTPAKLSCNRANSTVLAVRLAGNGHGSRDLRAAIRKASSAFTGREK